MWDDGMENVIEPVPIDDAFVTEMPKMEDIGDGGIVRCWFTCGEGGVRIVKAKLVIPLACAAAMSVHGTAVLTRMLATYPHVARLIGH
jgi:hypothetical protein